MLNKVYAIKDFHVKKDFNDKKLKENILDDRKIINSYANCLNKKTKELLLNDQFMNDLIKHLIQLQKIQIYLQL